MLMQGKSKIKKKAGVSMITTLLMLSVLFPLLLFLAVDITYYVQANKKLKAVVDNMAASATTRIREDILASGVISLNKSEVEYALFEDIMIWFNLEENLYGTNIEGVSMMKIREGEESLFNKNPLIIELEPDTRPDDRPYYNSGYNDEVLDSPRIEYFVHEHERLSTYHFSNDQRITVSTPTVGIFVHTTDYGIIFNIPMNMSKFGVSEVYFDGSVRDRGNNYDGIYYIYCNMLFRNYIGLVACSI